MELLCAEACRKLFHFKHTFLPFSRMSQCMQRRCRERLSQTVDWPWHLEQEGKQRRVIRRICSLTRNFCSLVNVVCLTWWDLLPRMRAAKGLFGKQAIHWLPNDGSREMANFIGLFLDAFSPAKCAQVESIWERMVALRSQKHREAFSGNSCRHTHTC